MCHYGSVISCNTLLSHVLSYLTRVSLCDRLLLIVLSDVSDFVLAILIDRSAQSVLA